MCVFILCADFVFRREGGLESVQWRLVIRVILRHYSSSHLHVGPGAVGKHIYIHEHKDHTHKLCGINRVRNSLSKCQLFELHVVVNMSSELIGRIHSDSMLWIF